MHTNSGLSNTADYDAVMKANLDEFYRKYKDSGRLIIVDDEEDLHHSIAEVMKCSEGKSVGFYDCTEVLNQYKSWFKIFKTVQPFYAMKCNPDKGMMDLMATFPGICIDCASSEEIQMCLDRGISPNNIIYANPVKSEDNVLYMMEKGVYCGTVDCAEEVEKLHTIIGEDCCKLKIVIRLYVSDDHCVVPLGSKYGCTLEYIPELLKTCKKYHMQVVGVAFHVGSGNTYLNAYRDAIRDSKTVFDLATKEGFKMNVLDFGGGWAGDLGGSELTIQNLEKTHIIIDNALKEFGFYEIDDLKLMSEPGRYFNDHTISVVCSIIGVQKHGERVIYRLNEGIMGIFKDVVLCGGMGFEMIPLAGDKEKMVDCSLIGPSNLKNDIVNEDVKLPLMNVGDSILFKKIGAYTLSLTTLALRKNQKCYYVIHKSSLSCL